MYYNSQDKVSKLARICQRDASYQTYIDAEIACQVRGESYNVLTDATFVNGTVFASFSKPDGPFESVICFKDIRQLNSSLVDEKLDFINGSCVLDNDLSYLDNFGKLPKCDDPKNYTEFILPEFTCAANMTDVSSYKGVIGKTQINFNYSVHNIYGKITKLFTTTVNEKLVLLAGTEDGHVIQFSIFEDGSLHEYDTSSVLVGTSKEDNQIHDLYHFPDGDALYALTKSKISKISARSCNESGVSVCVESETMKLKDPHCGWCVFTNKLSKMSECKDKWISSVDGLGNLLATISEEAGLLQKNREDAINFKSCLCTPDVTSTIIVAFKMDKDLAFRSWYSKLTVTKTSKIGIKNYLNLR
ncbi:PLXA2-like protein, partial [Mya arenaria]